MKVEIEDEDEFSPVSLRIEIASKIELGAMLALFNVAGSDLETRYQGLISSGSIASTMPDNLDYEAGKITSELFHSVKNWAIARGLAHKY